MTARITEPCAGNHGTARNVVQLVPQEAVGNLAHLAGQHFGTCDACGHLFLLLDPRIIALPAHKVMKNQEGDPPL